jgi:hypothetical protein
LQKKVNSDKYFETEGVVNNDRWEVMEQFTIQATMLHYQLVSIAHEFC